MPSYGGPGWDWLKEQDPEFKKLHEALVDSIFEPGEEAELPASTRAIIVSVIMCHRHYPTAGDHMRRAIHHGATLKQIIEALQAASIPGGFTILHYAFPFLMEIKADLDAGRPIYQGH